MYSFSMNNQSPWLVDVYNEHLDYKTDGFLVEIGVGHTLAGVNYIFEDTLRNVDPNLRVSSNTADLLDLGWSGIYIEPVSEYCDEARIAHAHNLDRLKIINVGASDKEEDLEFFINDTFIPNDEDARGYPWVHRVMHMRPTSDILEETGCPSRFDLLSLDVEGFEDKVLRALDFTRFRPKMMVIEINQVGVQQINDIIPSSYRLVREDGLNGVWVED